MIFLTQVKLSLPPSPVSLAYADHYLHIRNNPPPPPQALTWKDILAEEPFEGEHWEGVYGLPPGSVRNHNDGGGGQTVDSTPSLSPLHSDDLDLDADDSFSSLASTGEEETPQHLSTPPKMNYKTPLTYVHRKALEDLQKNQYWRSEWRSDADPGKAFDLGDASTFGMRNLQHSAVLDISDTDGKGLRSGGL